MGKIAIDVVLVPSDEMMDKAIKINKFLLKSNPKITVLNKKNCIPHISLAMGGLKRKDIKRVNEILKDIAQRFPALNLIGERIDVSTLSDGKVCSGLVIKKTEELQVIHEIIMKNILKYLTFDTMTDDFYAPPKVKLFAPQWVNNYRKNSSFQKFSPHITLGFGYMRNIKTPIKFTASTLALCHLGNYCTCRKLLSSFELSQLHLLSHH